MLEPRAARTASVAHNPPLDRQASWHQCLTECQRVDLLLLLYSHYVPSHVAAMGVPPSKQSRLRWAVNRKPTGALASVPCTRRCGFHRASAAVILEVHPAAPTLLLLSTETPRTRFALWTGWGRRLHQLIITEGMRTSRVTWRVLPKSAVRV